MSKIIAVVPNICEGTDQGFIDDLTAGLEQIPDLFLAIQQQVVALRRKFIRHLSDRDPVIARDTGDFFNQVGPTRNRFA